MSSSIQIFHYRDIPDIKVILQKIKDTKISKSKKYLDEISATTVLDYTISDVRRTNVKRTDKKGVEHTYANISGSFGYGYNESYRIADGSRSNVRKYADYTFTISYEHNILIVHGAVAKNKVVLGILSMIINGITYGFMEIYLSKEKIKYVHDYILNYDGNRLYRPYFIQGGAIRGDRDFINYGISVTCTTNDPSFRPDYKWASTWNPKWEIIECVGIMPIHEPKSRKLQIKSDSCFTLTGDRIPYPNWDTFVFEVFVEAWHLAN